jgi:hypothetical protein
MYVWKGNFSATVHKIALNPHFFGTFTKIQEIQFAFNCTFADGNGFKTSTMRLGADVLVFSRSHDNKERRLPFVILVTANCINHKLFVTVFDLSAHCVKTV